MAEDKEISRIKRLLQSVLISFKEGIAADKLLAEYEEKFGEELPFKKMGFKTGVDFIKSFHDVVIEKVVNGKLLCFAVPDDRTARIHRLVSKLIEECKNSKRHEKVGPKRILSKESQSKPLPRGLSPLAKRKSRSNKPNVCRVLPLIPTSLRDYKKSTSTDSRKACLAGTERTIKPSKIACGKTFKPSLLQIRRIPLLSLKDIHGISLASLMDIRRVPLTILMGIRNTQMLSHMSNLTAPESFLIDICRLPLPSIMDIRSLPLSLLMDIRRSSLPTLLHISQCPLSSLMNIHGTPLHDSHETVMAPRDENQISEPSVMDMTITLPSSPTDSRRTLSLPSVNSERPASPAYRQSPVSRNTRNPQLPLPVGIHCKFDSKNAQLDTGVSVHRQGVFSEMQCNDYYEDEIEYGYYNTVNEDKSNSYEFYDNECYNNASQRERYDHIYDDDRYYDNRYYDNEYNDRVYGKCYDNTFYHNDVYDSTYGFRSIHKQYSDNKFWHNDDYDSVYGYRSFDNKSE